LKPENFIFDTKDADSDLKVIDFGLSKIIDPATCKKAILIIIAKGCLQRMKTRAGTVINNT